MLSDDVFSDDMFSDDEFPYQDLNVTSSLYLESFAGK